MSDTSGSTQSHVAITTWGPAIVVLKKFNSLLLVLMMVSKDGW